MAEIFVSIMGTQIFGTLQPWLAYYKATPPSKTIFMHTKESEAHAIRAKEYADKRGMGEIVLKLVPDTLEAEDSAPGIIRELAEKAAGENERICFNLNSSFTYMGAACVMAVEPFQPVLIQSSLARIVCFDVKSEEFYTLPLPEPFPVSEILALQGVSHLAGKAKSQLVKFCGEEGIKLPDNNLTDVIIDNIYFDVVWNPGNNRLSFLCDRRKSGITGAPWLAHNRSLAQWARDRRRKGHLHDIRVYAIVNNSPDEEHLREESDDSITAVNILGHTSQSLTLKQTLENWFKVSQKQYKGEILKTPQKSSAGPVTEDALVVCVGKDISSTLSVIGTHHPKKLILCYTKEDKIVKAHAASIVKFAPELGIEEVILVPFRIDGAFADKYLPQVKPGVKIQVNVTPGTKGQGGMLALWAMKKGYSVWTLRNDACVSAPLYNPYNESPLPIELVDPALFMRIKGQELKQDGIPGVEIENDAATTSLLEFLLRFAESGQGKLPFVEDIFIGDDSLRQVSNTRWQLHYEGDDFTIVLPEGKWFEKLITLVMLRAGVKNTRTNIKDSYDAKTERAIIERHELKEDPHLLEADVVGTYCNNYVLISCKSNPYDPIDAAAIQARDTAQNFGRYCLSMLAHTGCRESVMFRNKVRIFGWREICHPATLGQFLADLAKSQRTTSQD